MAARGMTLRLLAALALLLAGCGPAAPPSVETVTIGEHTFRLDLATDPARRARGLSGVADIPEDGGMLFVFVDPEVQSFWMKDCLVDIDIIYLDARGRVTATHRMKALEPQGENETELAYERRVRSAGQYDSVFPALFAIELRAGWLDRLDLQVEDKIELDVERLRSFAVPD